MKIEKYRYLGNGRYKVYINNEEYIIYEDIILKYNILSKENISKKDLELYLKNNVFYEAYYKAVKYINIKLRSKEEIKNYLKKDFSLKTIDDVIKRLTKDGYLNEDIYAEAYINDQINLKIVGPLKIKRDLTSLGISEAIIDKHLDCFTRDIQFEKINKTIEKEIKLNKNKSVFMLKNKILSSLINKGFYKEDILSCIDNYDFKDDDIYKKEYDKLYKKLCSKYKGLELEYKIKEKLYQKGFRL